MTIGESEHRSKIFEISFMEVMLVEDCWDDLTPSITNFDFYVDVLNTERCGAPKWHAGN